MLGVFEQPVSGKFQKRKIIILEEVENFEITATIDELRFRRQSATVQVYENGKKTKAIELNFTNNHRSVVCELAKVPQLLRLSYCKKQDAKGKESLELTGIEGPDLDNQEFNLSPN